MIDKPPEFFEGTEMPIAGWWEAFWPDPAGVLASAGLKPGMDAIDLCAGDGWFTLQIAKVVQKVAAIDIDPALLEVAWHRLEEAAIDNCDYLVGNAYDIARLTAAVDFVFMANAFHGVPDRPRLAQAIKGVLRPRGSLAIVNWHKRPRGETQVLGEPRRSKTELRMSLEETIGSVQQGGLKLSPVVEIPPYQYRAVFTQ